MLEVITCTCLTRGHSWEPSVCSQVCRLESARKHRDRTEKVAGEGATSCGPKCSRLEDELQQTRGRLARIQEEAERQRDRQQREVTALRADKHRLEEKVLEQSRLDAERNLLDQSQRHTEDQMRSATKALNIQLCDMTERPGGKGQQKVELQCLCCTTGASRSFCDASCNC